MSRLKYDVTHAIRTMWLDRYKMLSAHFAHALAGGGRGVHLVTSFVLNASLVTPPSFRFPWRRKQEHCCTMGDAFVKTLTVVMDGCLAEYWQHEPKTGPYQLRSPPHFGYLTPTNCGTQTDMNGFSTEISFNFFKLTNNVPQKNTVLKYQLYLF